MTRVLIVDDSDGVRAAVSMLLEDEGFETLAVSTYAQALDQFKSGKFSLALIDAHLGTHSGVELARELLSQDPQAVIVLMSGAVFHDPTAGLPILQKPFSKRELLEFIHRVLDQAA
ncbi:MAG TPA: response regulator [Terriglobales bacterium]|nr:response regulator [Terriglobales bacterium]